MIPARWTESARRFADVPDSNVRVSSNEDAGRPALAWPPTAAACVAFVSCGVDAIEACERAASRLYDAVDCWRSPNDRGGDKPAGYVWDLVPVGGVIRYRGATLVPHRAAFAIDAAARAIEDHDAATFERMTREILEEDGRISAALEDRTGLDTPSLARLRFWSVARELDLSIPPEARRKDHGLGKTPRSLRGKRFTDVADIAPDIAAIALAGFGATWDGGGLCVVRPQLATLAAR